MIAHLRGTLVVKRPPHLVVDVGGVGYELEAPMTTFYDLPSEGEAVHLHTHLLVREDAHLLYGFSRRAERDLFRRLIRISGVGGRLALALLSGMNAEELARTVREGDSARLVRLPGIGKKTAERLIVELRDQFKDFAPVATAATAGGMAAPKMGGPLDEARGALEALGYKPAEVSRMLARVDAEGLGTEEIIRQALQGAAR